MSKQKPKQEPLPSVSGMLDTTERLLDKAERERLLEADPLALAGSSGERDKLITERDEQDIERALKDPAMRRLMYRIFTMGGLLDHLGDPNNNIMAHAIGRRSLVVDLHNEVNKIQPGILGQMIREHVSNEKSQEEPKQ